MKERNISMKIIIISSSHRKNSNSLKVSKLLMADLLEQDKKLEVNILELSQDLLPFWDDDMWESSPNELKEKWSPLSKSLKAAHGFIFVTPEWNGMVAPALHNLFLFCSQHEMTHKPALITSVSTGVGGAYPISELRSTGYKNTRVCYLPDHLIFRYVNKFFDPKNQTDPENLRLKERITGTLKIFRTYCEGFVAIRKANNFDFKKYPNGM